MKVDVEATIVIDRPIDEVAAYAGDPSNAPAWYRRIQSAEWQTDPPLAAGSRVTFRAKFLGKQLDYTYEVTEYEPPRRLTMRTSEGPFPMNTHYSWEPATQGSTRMTLQNHGEPSGFSKLTAPLLAVAMRRAMREDLRALKQLIEERNQPSG